MIASGQAGRLVARHARTANPADLDHAITLGQQALDATPMDQPDWVVVATRQAILLQDRFTVSGDQSDLEAALRLSEMITAHTPPAPFHGPQSDRGSE
jgi:hypothetical protein